MTCEAEKKALEDARYEYEKADLALWKEGAGLFAAELGAVLAGAGVVTAAGGTVVTGGLGTPAVLGALGLFSLASAAILVEGTEYIQAERDFDHFELELKDALRAYCDCIG